jgi:hypothetical protein
MLLADIRMVFAAHAVDRVYSAVLAKGYLRADFEEAWRAYCDDSNGTTSQASKIIPLPRK